MIPSSICSAWPARPAVWRSARSRWARPAAPGRPPGPFGQRRRPQYLPPGRPLRRGWKCPVAGGPLHQGGAGLRPRPGLLRHAGPDGRRLCPASLTQKLAVRAPERYGPAAQQLREKADRVLQRQREQRQHEKNLREGKKAPWAPPPPKRNEPSKQDGRPAQKGKQPPRKGRGGSAPHPSAPGGRKGSGPSSRPGGPHNPGPGGRRLSGKFRHNP